MVEVLLSEVVQVMVGSGLLVACQRYSGYLNAAVKRWIFAYFVTASTGVALKASTDALPKLDPESRTGKRNQRKEAHDWSQPYSISYGCEPALAYFLVYSP